MNIDIFSISLVLGYFLFCCIGVFLSIKKRENTIQYKIGDIVIASPTETEVKVVEAKTGKAYSDYLTEFLLANSIEEICDKYDAKRKEDIPLCVAMAVFESV